RHSNTYTAHASTQLASLWIWFCMSSSSCIFPMHRCCSSCTESILRTSSTSTSAVTHTHKNTPMHTHTHTHREREREKTCEHEHENKSGRTCEPDAHTESLLRRGLRLCPPWDQRTPYLLFSRIGSN